MVRRTLVAAAALGFAALGLTACGGGSGSSGGSGDPNAIYFEADSGGSFAYTETDITAPAKDKEIEFNNPSSIPHDVVIEDENGQEVVSTDTIVGDTTTVKASLAPGTYTYYCSISNHRDAGMEGTLTVE